LGLHNHPVLIVNIGGYWDPLIALIRHAAEQGFVRPQHARLFQEVAGIEDILPALAVKAETPVITSNLI
jgi:predicted Rossmann-fold nucleotide-binding protein